MKRRPVPVDRGTPSGMALVVVLACLVFLVALGVAFLFSGSTEVKSSNTYAEGGRAQMFAQSAAALAQAQIADGTRGVDGSGNLLAWASQPGMIRTYDNAGNPGAYYKLYSWDKMSDSGSFDPSAHAEKVASDWYEQKAVYTDLNQPIESGTGKLYPILDGNDLTLEITDVASGKKGKTYDGGSGTAAIAGFFVSSAATPANPGPGGNPIPMPVKWLYVLKGGQIVAPTGGNGDTATFSGSNAPTTDNPIVGRIAFWADDETCKVNINTASEGTYSDTPRLGVLSKDDEDLIFNQPVTHEYQRYPGHPGMTSLSVVLPLSKDDIYAIAPRISSGGSDAGQTRTAMGAGITLTPDSDRLYASVDELVFKPDASGGTRPVNHPALTQKLLDRSRFFLTASSRSPEVNLFGRPRVSIWPVSVHESHDFRSGYDNTFAFCATMRHDLGAGKYRYYFQREKAGDPTNDLDGIPRNRVLLDYLRYLMSQQIPGFKGSLADKYHSLDAAGILPAATTECDQILTEIFDYVRSTNLSDTAISGTANRFSALGEVVPIENTANGTRGFGRFRTVQGANFLFLGKEEVANVSGGTDVRVQAFFIPQLFDVAVGTIFNSKPFSLTMEGLQSFTVSTGTTPAVVTTNLGYDNSIQASLPNTSWNFRYGANFGAQFGFLDFCMVDAFSKLLSVEFLAPKDGSFVFNGGDVTFRMNTSGGLVAQTVKLRFPPARFPTPKLAKPDYMDGSFGPYNLRDFNVRRYMDRDARNAWFTSDDVVRSVSANPGDMRLIAARVNPPGPDSDQYAFKPNAQYGDMSTMGNPVGQAHNLWGGDGYPYGNTFNGKLVRGLGYDSYSKVFPDVPMNGVALGKNTSFAAGDIPGDWDTGVAEIQDGPYINRADEGDKGKMPNLWPYKWKYHIGYQALDQTIFTPNRLLPSAVMFGSLSTGVLANKPWQTLLFRPGPAGHPGLGTPVDGPPFTTPPDYLLLDLFWMPVIEPYPISEPLSTAGKINMNYQIVPFTYINRDTGIRAILKSEKVISIKDSDSANYKHHYGSPAVAGMSRQAVDADQTLTRFLYQFEVKKDIFRSPSQICGIDIIPVDLGANAMNDSTSPGAARTKMDAYWNSRLLTGDNCRERPYATIYPRLTTQSNTYTIHFRAQALKKVRNSSPVVWDEKKDRVTGEYRGFQTVERYIDPNDSQIPDYAIPGADVPIGSFYKYRVVQAKQFAP